MNILFLITRRIEAKNKFSLFDLSAMDEGDPDDVNNQPTPFLNIETTIIDESNFDTNTHRRLLKLDVNVSKRKGGDMRGK